MNPRLPHSAATLTLAIALLSSFAAPELHDGRVLLPVVQRLADLCFGTPASEDADRARRQFPVIEILRRRAAAH